jgi:sugar phosphate isomerase/epimerase
MKLAVSNIAWDPHEDDAVAAVMRGAGATGVEIAPTKRWATPLAAPAKEIAEYRSAWEDRGLRIVAMQSLLFGQPDLQLFGGAASRAALDAYLRGILDLAAELGAGAVVFGSPRYRTRGSLPIADANAVAAEFLRSLGAHAHERRVAFCVEPVPARYGSDYIETMSEALALVAAVDHPGIRVNADLGAMIAAGDDPAQSIIETAAWTGHFHASEPGFVELADTSSHARAADGLASARYAGWVSIEVSAQANPGDHVGAVERSVRRAAGAYGPAD